MLVKKVDMKEGKYVLRITCSFFKWRISSHRNSIFSGRLQLAVNINLIASKFTGILAFLPVLIATKVSALKD